MSDNATIRRPERNPVQTVRDSIGRTLTVQAVSPAEELDLVEAAGASADSRAWMIRATLYACVRAIDGVPLQFPATKAKIKAAAGLVGSEGLSALTELYAPPSGDEGEGDDGSAAVATAKN